MWYGLIRLTLAVLIAVVLAQLGAATHRVGAVAKSIPVPISVSTEKALATFGKLPLAFVPNAGQIDARVRYYAQASGAAFYFTAQEAVFDFSERMAGPAKGVVLRLGFVGANPAPRIEGARSGAGTVNYIIGSDSSAWRTGLVTYEQIAYRDLWPGVDLIFRGNGGSLKYEFHLEPGAQVSDIRLVYRGTDRLALGQEGDLLVHTAVGVLRDPRPTTYQIIEGREVPIESSYLLASGTSYGFAVDDDRYDPRRPLVIDPGLVYSTFIGGTRQDSVWDIVVDSWGYAYVTGRTAAGRFPTTVGAFDTTYNGQSDVFVAKLKVDGSALVYSTFLGGAGGDVGYGITVNSEGQVYITGQTSSADFPVTPQAFDTTYDVDDAFVTQLNASGSALVYSTFLGGSGGDAGSGIALDDQGHAYVTGATSSDDFPITPGAFDSTVSGGDLFVTKMSADGSTLVYSTVVGGSGGDTPFSENPAGIKVDAEGHAYVTGDTNSSDFPTTAGAFDTEVDGVDAFVTKLNPEGSALVYSTFLGGTAGEHGCDIGIDSQGHAYVTGTTTSADFPTTAGAFDRTFDGFNDGFVTKLSPDGAALVYSTLIGGNGSGAGDGSRNIAVTPDGSAYITGHTQSADFPTTPGAFDTTFSGYEAFLTKLTVDGSALAYSTFLGGTDVDTGTALAVHGHAYVTGPTRSADFPVTPGAFDTTFPRTDTKRRAD